MFHLGSVADHDMCIVEIKNLQQCQVCFELVYSKRHSTQTSRSVSLGGIQEHKVLPCFELYFRHFILPRFGGDHRPYEGFVVMYLFVIIISQCSTGDCGAKTGGWCVALWITGKITCFTCSMRMRRKCVGLWCLMARKKMGVLRRKIKYYFFETIKTWKKGRTGKPAIPATFKPGCKTGTKMTDFRRPGFSLKGKTHGVTPEPWTGWLIFGCF